MKFLSRHLSNRHLTTLGMLVVTLLLLLVGGLQWKSGNDFRVSRDRVTHTRIVMLDLESLFSSLLDAETGERGYLLTHKDTYLEPYNNSLVYSHDQIQALEQVITDPAQQKRFSSLKHLIRAQFDELAQTISLEQKGNHAGALLRLSDDSAKKSMDAIRSAVLVMQNAETNLMQRREDIYQLDSGINSELSVMLIVLGFGSVLAMLFFFLVRRLERMQEMVTICAWSKLIEFEGKWLSIEEYLSSRLHARVTHGISRNETEKMLQLIELEKLKKALSVL